MSGKVALMAKYVSTEERFFQKVSKTGSCWIWIGALNSKGYGSFAVGGKSMLSHRYSFLIHKGPIPDGAIICHTCDTPACVNPEHLWAGTYRDNSLDMFDKDRQSIWTKEQTHCRKGHRFEEFGVLVYTKKTGRQIGKQWRTCKECKRINDQSRFKKNK